jgi:hypothetical protein
MPTPMTAQRVYEILGFLPIASHYRMDVGKRVEAGLDDGDGDIVAQSAGAPLLIAAEISREEFEAALEKVFPGERNASPYEFHYKAVAE